ncbi:hypothetical protein V5799_027397 [Amblyomma americanum]|uniref:Secreted protein n=1 Tax=Amblyomma americanum TaxID=6943 RepID=A0AAQ4DFU5_AMBAM
MKFLLFTLLLSLGDVDHGRGRAISAAVTPNSSGASVGPLARNLSPATGVASRNDTVDWAEICSGDKKNETCEGEVYHWYLNQV